MPKYLLKGIHNWTKYTFTFELGMQPSTSESQERVLSVYRNDNLPFVKESKELKDEEQNNISTCDHLNYRLPSNSIFIQGGGYCRIANDDFFFSKPVKVTCSDKYGKIFRNEIIINVEKLNQSDEGEYLTIKHINGKVFKNIFLTDSPTDNDQVIEFYLSISKKGYNESETVYDDGADLGFFIEPMSGNWQETKGSLKAIAKPLFELFNGQREKVTLNMGTTSHFTLKAGDDDIDTNCTPINKDEEQSLIQAKAVFIGNMVKTPKSIPFLNDVPFGTFKIRCSTPTMKFAENNEKVKFSVCMDNFFQLVNVTNNTFLKWGITQPTGSKHTINTQTGVLKSVATPDGTIHECSVSVTFEINLLMSWPVGWLQPFAGEKDIEWTKDIQGHESLWILYSLLKSLPAEIRKLLSQSKIVRRELQNIECDFIPFTNKIIISDKLILTGNVNMIAVEMMKAISHAILCNKTGKKVQETFFKIIQGLSLNPQINDPTLLLRDRMFYNGLKIIFPITIMLPPVYTLNLIFELFAQQASDIKDNMCEFCENTGWKMNNFKLRTVPVVGWFLGTFTKQAPNYIFASAAAYNCFKYELGLYNEHNENNNWIKAGMCAKDALAGPTFDFSMTFLKFALADGILKAAELNLTEVDEVRKIFMERHYFRNTWRPIQASQLKVYSHIRFSDDLYTSSNSGFSIKSNKKVFPQDQEYEDLFYSVKHLFTNWHQGAGKLFTQTTDTLKKIESPVRDHSMKEFVRTLEIHHKGLELFNQEITECSPGDILISYDQDEKPYPWIITEINEQKQLASVTGVIPFNSIFLEEKMVKNPTSFKYIWKASSNKRQWPDNNIKNSYKDLSTSLAHLIRLWGEHIGKYDLKTIGGFFMEFLDASGLRDETYSFETGTHLQGVLNYCNTHGKGLEYYTPDVPLQAGDIIFPFIQNTIGIVLKVNGIGQPVDVLWGGTGQPGLMGEDDATVKVQHDFDYHECYYYWKPTKSTRIYI